MNLHNLVDDCGILQLDGAEVNWNRILRNDPLNCCLSLVCALAAGAEEQNSEAGNINAFVQ